MTYYAIGKSRVAMARLRTSGWCAQYASPWLGRLCASRCGAFLVRAAVATNALEHEADMRLVLAIGQRRGVGIELSADRAPDGGLSRRASAASTSAWGAITPSNSNATCRLMKNSHAMTWDGDYYFGTSPEPPQILQSLTSSDLLPHS